MSELIKDMKMNDITQLKLATGDEFFREIFHLLVDDHRLVGNSGQSMCLNRKVVNFKQPKDLEEILDLKITDEGLRHEQLVHLARLVIEYSVKTNSPTFYNQLYGGVDQYGLAGSLIADVLNTSQATYEISPVFTLVERWLINYCGRKCDWKSDSIDGIFTPGGSLANMFAMILARQFMFPDVKENGVHDRLRLVALCSDNAHYSFVKSSIWMGHGTSSVVKVETDENGRMRPDALDAAIVQSLLDGRQPFMVACTAGTTVLGAIDSLNEIAEICQKYDLWMHVDAALGGSLLLSSKQKHRLRGIEKADSVTWNLHKMAGIPLQCSLFLTQHVNLLKEANGLNAEYLFQSDKYYDTQYDTGDKSIQCGRKVDSLKLYMALVARGEAKWQQLIDNVIDVRDYFIEKISKHADFRLVRDKFDSSTVCFWFIPRKLRNRQLTQVALNQLCVRLKNLMMINGQIMINYQPLPVKNLPNFFRLSLTCIPPPSFADMDIIIAQFEKLGEMYTL